MNIIYTEIMLRLLDFISCKQYNSGGLYSFVTDYYGNTTSNSDAKAPN